MVETGRTPASPWDWQWTLPGYRTPRGSEGQSPSGGGGGGGMVAVDDYHTRQGNSIEMGQSMLHRVQGWQG